MKVFRLHDRGICTVQCETGSSVTTSVLCGGKQRQVRRVLAKTVIESLRGVRRMRQNCFKSGIGLTLMPISFTYVPAIYNKTS